MFHSLISILVAGGVTALIGAAAAGVTRRWWEGSNYLGVSLGVTGVAAASYVVFLVTWASPIAGKLISLVIVAVSAAILVRMKAWTAWRQVAPMVLITAGTIVAYVGFLYLWHTQFDAFQLAQARFAETPLPIDNHVPVLFADRLASGQSTHLLLLDWNGSDRPPLQAGLILLTRVFDLRIAGAVAQGFGASVISQALWIPALYALLRSAAIPRRASFAGVAMVAVTGTTLVNTVFTWPKMMSAALILVSCAFLIEAARRPSNVARNLALAVATYMFGMLAHGAAAFAVPFVIILGLIALRRSVHWSAWRSVVAAGVVGGAVYVPWALYQRFADPPGDRLIKWHLAGVISAGDPRSALTAISDSLSSLSLAEWWSGRVDNLATVIGSNPWSGIHCGCTADLVSRRSAEFYTTTAALGLAYPALLAVLAVIIVLFARRRRLGSGDKAVLFAVAASAASIAMWCVLMFMPRSTVVHQGSQVWIILLIAAPTTWLALRRPWLAWALVATQAAATIVVYAPATNGGGLSAAGLLLAVAGVCACVGGVLIAHASSPETATPAAPKLAS
ncbi:hypothetical protein [Demequina lutea]|uniref:Dolichyl-phosphate-mannose-protein mannosyltransferase n=1 Tax=Demequina lutea TaxID=431489 RepID=A0A7Y9ZCQ1_9MICO|nr:hypothetical protein [Demequina lutea]NYI42455.1 hypothetical protein [Demequina lutea]